MHLEQVREILKLIMSSTFFGKFVFVDISYTFRLLRLSKISPLKIQIFAILFLLGTHGLWCGSIEEVVVDVLLDLLMLQKFKKRRLCYVLDEIPEDLSRCSQIF